MNELLEISIKKLPLIEELESEEDIFSNDIDLEIDNFYKHDNISDIEIKEDGQKIKRGPKVYVYKKAKKEDNKIEIPMVLEIIERQEEIEEPQKSKNNNEKIELLTDITKKSFKFKKIVGELNRWSG